MPRSHAARAGLGLATVLAVLLCCALSASAHGHERLEPEKAKPNEKGVTRYTLAVTAGTANPDCARSRPVILINGKFQPTLEVASGDRLEVRLPCMHDVSCMQRCIASACAACRTPAWGLRLPQIL